MDYAKVWKGMGLVLGMMGSLASNLMKELRVPLAIPAPAEWAPAQIPELTGWKRGTVLFFNLTTRSGRIKGEDGIEYYVGYRQVVDVEEPLGILEPMAGVYFRPGVQEGGQAFTPVRSCKPA